MRPRLLHLGYESKYDESRPDDFYASMRPRLLHLGYMEPPDHDHIYILPGFNEAEAFTPRIRAAGSHRRDRLLQLQ